MTYKVNLGIGVFIRGGMGHTWLRHEVQFGPLTSGALAYLVGVGLEAAVGRNVSFGPMVTYHRTFLEQGTEAIWVFGVAITMDRRP